MNRIMLISKSRNSWVRACFALCLVALFSLTGCKKEYFELDRVKDATWNPELAVPLIKSTVTVPEVLDRFDDDEIIVVDTTGILALKYFSEIFSISADSVLIFQDQSATQFYPLLPSDITTLNGGNAVVVPTITAEVGCDMANMSHAPEIHSVSFKNGTMTIGVTSQHSYPSDITLQMPGLVNATSGQSFSQGVVGVSSSNPQTVTLSLQDWTMDLTLGSQGFNEIRVITDATINPGGSGNPGDRIDVSIGLTGMEFSSVIGDVKMQTFGSPASDVRIRFFENQQDGDIYWADPRVKAVFTNGLGAEVQLNVQQLDFVSTSGTIALTGPLNGTTTIAHNSTIGGTAETVIDVNNSNSNIVTVAADEPNKLLYQVGAVTNPNGVGSGLNWFLDTSRVKLDMEVYLPFHGRAEGFAKADTTEVEIFPIDGDIKEIEYVTFRLIIDNGFPADARAQVYFYDSTLVDSNFVGIPTPIDSMFGAGEGVVFASPTPDGSGRIDQNNKMRSVLDITLDREKLEKLEAMKFTHLVSKGWVDTYNSGQTEIRVFSDYSMDLYLGVIVKIKADVDL